MKKYPLLKISLLFLLSLTIGPLSLSAAPRKKPNPAALKHCYKRVSRLHHSNLQRCRVFRNAKYRKACYKKAGERYVAGRKLCRRKYK